MPLEGIKYQKYGDIYLYNHIHTEKNSRQHHHAKEVLLYNLFIMITFTMCTVSFVSNVLKQKYMFQTFHHMAKYFHEKAIYITTLSQFLQILEIKIHHTHIN